ncbi:hypothetical protein LJC11_01215 [Bacteroidales bacterium OttesenSCG-928-I21]|nr:hypothetical protein [Bacteroidales bacterium OttesenSCG-928-I21]
MNKYNNNALQKLIDYGYEFETYKYINGGFNIFLENIGGFIGYSFIIIAVMGISSLKLFLNIPMSLMSSIFYTGFFLVANEIIKGRNPNFSTFFCGFNFFIPLLLLSLISSIFIMIGLLLLIIPGIYLAVSYQFSSMFVVFLGYDFWEAMEMSRKIITKNWWKVFWFTLLIGIINFLGMIAFGIGVIFTLPATYCMIFYAFEDIIGTALRKNQYCDDSNANYTTTTM